MRKYDAVKEKFNLLLTWHLERGTRPNGSADSERNEKQRWLKKEFARECSVSAKTVTNWCRAAPTVPDEWGFKKIEEQLLGLEPLDRKDKFGEFRTDLRSAYSTARSSTNADRPIVFTEALRTVTRSLLTPRSVIAIDEEFAQAAHRIIYGDTTFREVALLIEPFGAPWSSEEISWKALDRPFKTDEFWQRVDSLLPLATTDPTDNLPGKHVRLVAASQRRGTERGCRLDFLWQRISWRDSSRTNGRISEGLPFQGAPLWAWFSAQDFLIPSADGYSAQKDVPLANRLAINLAVILRSKGEDWALFQERAHDLTASPRHLELGISESIHGDTGWEDFREIDVRNGTPDILRTARRCLWQELGLAERGSLRREIPTFDLNVQFTALVLNKQELSPRLLGFIEIWGSVEDVERASRESIGLSHKEFGERPDKDPVPWERVRVCQVTREAFAAVFRRLRDRVSPDCRARLLYYLKVKYPETWNVVPATEEPPSWL